LRRAYWKIKAEVILGTKTTVVSAFRDLRHVIPNTSAENSQLSTKAEEKSNMHVANKNVIYRT